MRIYMYRWTQLLLFSIILYYDRLFNNYYSMSISSVCAFSLVLKNASRQQHQRKHQLLLLLHHYHSKTIIMTKMVPNDLDSINENNNENKNDNKDTINESQQQQQQSTVEKRKKVILCLHGKNQSGDIFALKIAGAKRKLQRLYDLHFLTAPISLEQEIQLLYSFNNDNNENNNKNEVKAPTISGDNNSINNVYAWWIRDKNNNHLYVTEAIDYVINEMIQSNKQYDAIIGFSQGGTLATILSGFCCTSTTTASTNTNNFPDVLSTIKCIVTAGAPYHEQAFSIANDYYDTTTIRDDSDNETVYDDEFWTNVRRIPKFHFAGMTDTLVPLSSTKTLHEKSSIIITSSSSNATDDSIHTVVNTTGRTVNSNNSSSSVLHIHDQGHLFPTRSVQVTEMLQFLQQHLS